MKYTLCLGAYYLESWQDQQAIVFGRNDTWFERVQNPNRYKIKGVMMRVIKTSEDPDATWKEFNDKSSLDATGIPTSQLQEQIGKEHVYQTKGDSTFKLNVNSCTQDRWDELFGNNPDSNWVCKPWMSNDAFLQGLYWSINREEYAANRGVTPSINYFADAYLSDPENGISYNSTEEHKAAVAKYHTVREVDGQMVDNYGYDLSKAVNYFKLAVQQLVSSGAIKYGTSSKPTEIHISINWMYQTDKVDYGNDIVTYFENAFNDQAVSQGRVKLVVDQPDPSTQWDDVYNKVMMKGQFDLAFGAISGNTYSPLNFLEVLKSDNSSGFTLNWGPDTSKVDENKPLVFDGKKWSFDALWEVADRGGVVENGAIVKTCKNYYLDGTYKTLEGAQTETLRNGANVNVNLEFVELDTVKIEINKVQVYIVGGSNVDVTNYEYANRKLSIEISQELADSLFEELNSIVNKNKSEGDEGYVADPLARSKYNTYYTIEIYYTLSIKKNNEWGTPSQQMVTMALAKEDQAK